MGFNASTLTDYVDQNRLPLLQKATIASKTQSLISLEAGIKGTSALNYFDVEPVIQPGGCGWNPSGSTNITQRTITVVPLKVEDSLCPQDLDKYWMNYTIKNGGVDNPLPFENYLVDELVRKLGEQNEKGIWQSTSGSTSYKGLLQIIDAEATEIDLSGVTGIINIVNKMYLEIPEEVKTDAVMFVSPAFLSSYAVALTSANMFHYNPTDNADGFMIPGTNTKIIGIPGLIGEKYIICGNPKNFVWGTDDKSDLEAFKIWYSEDNDEWRYRVRWSMGTEIYFPNEVIYAKYV